MLKHSYMPTFIVSSIVFKLRGMVKTGPRSIISTKVTQKVLNNLLILVRMQSLSGISVLYISKLFLRLNICDKLVRVACPDVESRYQILDVGPVL